jgi:hypothetical protein
MTKPLSARAPLIEQLMAAFGVKHEDVQSFNVEVNLRAGTVMVNVFYRPVAPSVTPRFARHTLTEIA